MAPIPIDQIPGTPSIFEAALFLHLPCPPPHSASTFLLYSFITIAHGSVLLTRRRLPWGASKPDLTTRTGWTLLSLCLMWIAWQTGCWWAAVFAWGLRSSQAVDYAATGSSVWAWASYLGLLLTSVTISVTALAFWAASVTAAVSRVGSAWLTVPWMDELDEEYGEAYWDEERGVRKPLLREVERMAPREKENVLEEEEDDAESVEACP